MRSGPRPPLSDLLNLQQPLLDKSLAAQHRHPLPLTGRCADLSMVKSSSATDLGSPPAEIVGIKRKRTVDGSLGRRSSTASVTERVGAVNLAGGKLKSKVVNKSSPATDENEEDSSVKGSSVNRRRSSARRSASASRSGLVAFAASASSSASSSGPSSVNDEDDEDASYDLMDPSDEHLVSVASRAELGRVRKPELVRLWRVAGLLADEDEEGDNATTAEDMRKDELVDGLIDARSLMNRPANGQTTFPIGSAAALVLDVDEAGERSGSGSGSDDSNPTPRRRRRTVPALPPPAPLSPAASTSSLPTAEIEGRPVRHRRTRTCSGSSSVSAASGSAASGPSAKGKERERPSAADQPRKMSTPMGAPAAGRRRPRLAGAVRERSVSLGSGASEDDEATPRAAKGILPKRRHSSNTASAAAGVSPPGLHRRASHRRATSPAQDDPFGGPPMTRSGSSQSNNSTTAAAVSSQRAATRRSSAGPSASTNGANGGRIKRLPRRQAKAKALEALKLGEETSSEDDDRHTSLSDEEDDSPESSDNDGSAYESSDGNEMHVDGDSLETRTPGGKTHRRLPSSRTARRANRTTRAAASDVAGAPIEPLMLKPTRAATEISSRSQEESQQPTPPSDEDEDHDADEEAAEQIEGDNAAGVEVNGDEVHDLPRAAKRSGLRTLKVAEPITEVEEDQEVADGGEVQMADANEMAESDDIDLERHTAATLLRLRRNALERLCETRALDIAGTKPQLAQALIDWRDSNATSDDSAVTSPALSTTSSRRTARVPRSAVLPASSAGTAVSDATERSGGGRRKGRRLHADDPAFATDAKVTPTLLRGDHVHQEQTHPSPTPPPSGHAHQAAAAEELNLDLESLGLEDKEIPEGQLQKMEKVGSGGFKDVYVGKLRGRMKVAIAEFRGQLGEMDIKELKLLADFKHPNIVKFLGVCIPEDRRTPIMMVSELCENGDLFDYIRNVPAPSKKVVIKLMLDISRGLQYLHLHKPAVIHRDCKSSNILITSRVVAKVGDFGLARVKHSTRSMIRSLVGTVCYQPPEMWTAHPKYDSKVDVYSCAMVFWEMLQWHKAEKKYPWEGSNEHAIYDLVGAKRLRPSVHKLHTQWGSDIVDLMEEMWVQEPKERPTMTAVVERLETILKTS